MCSVLQPPWRSHQATLFHAAHRRAPLHQGRALGFGHGVGRGSGRLEIQVLPNSCYPPPPIHLPFLLWKFVCACLRAAEEKLRLASKQWDCVQPVSEGWPPQTPCTSHSNLHVLSCQESVACTDSPQSHLDAGPGSTTLFSLSALI